MILLHRLLAKVFGQLSLSFAAGFGRGSVPVQHAVSPCSSFSIAIVVGVRIDVVGVGVAGCVLNRFYSCYLYMFLRRNAS